MHVETYSLFIQGNRQNILHIISLTNPKKTQELGMCLRIQELLLLSLQPPPTSGTEYIAYSGQCGFTATYLGHGPAQDPSICSRQSWTTYHLIRLWPRLKDLRLEKAQARTGKPPSSIKLLRISWHRSWQEHSRKWMNMFPLSPHILQAHIVVLPKPGIDHSQCSNYRLISLLKVELFSKIIENRLTPLIHSLVHSKPS